MAPQRSSIVASIRCGGRWTQAAPAPRAVRFYALDNDVVRHGAPSAVAARLERQVTAIVPQGRTGTRE
jgi:hypothetical protein